MMRTTKRRDLLHALAALQVAGLHAVSGATTGAGTVQNFNVYNEEYYTGYIETIAQNAEIFNERSRNTLRIVSEPAKGHLEKAAFVKALAQGDAIQHRDVTSIAAVENAMLQTDEEIAPKLNRRIGPVMMTQDSFRKIGDDPAVISVWMGRQIAQATLLDHIQIAALSLRATLGKDAATQANRRGSNSGLATTDLTQGLKLFGDAEMTIRAFMMHGQTRFNLLEKQQNAAATSPTPDPVAGVAIAQGFPASMDRPILMTDQGELYESPGQVGFLDSAINAAATDVELEDNSPHTIAVNDVLWIDDEAMQVTTVTDQHTFVVTRGHGSTTAAAHADGARVRLGGYALEHTYGLAEDAVMINLSEPPNVVVEQNITGYENLMVRVQGEYAVSPRIKGWKYTSAGSGTNAQLAASANWTQVAASIKDGPGVLILSDVD